MVIAAGKKKALGPAPWVMPFNNLGCCFSQAGQAKVAKLIKAIVMKRIDFFMLISFRFYLAALC